MSQIAEILERPVWEGGKTLHMGEVLCFIVALALIFWLGKVSMKSWYVWGGLLLMLVAMILF